MECAYYRPSLNGIAAKLAEVNLGPVCLTAGAELGWPGIRPTKRRSARTYLATYSYLAVESVAFGRQEVAFLWVLYGYDGAVAAERLAVVPESKRAPLEEMQTRLGISQESSFVPHNIIAIGEILWDVFPDGPRFGGAPANFGCSAAELGRAKAVVTMVSAVGDDELGRLALAALANRGVHTAAVQVNGYPTGRVDVKVDEQGAASYQFAENCAWDHLAWNRDLEELAKGCDAVCFGTLGQRGRESAETIQALVRATRASALRILDVNIREPFISDELILSSLELANVLKLNDEELPVVARLCNFSGSDIEILRRVSRRFGLRYVALTRGPQGAVIVSEDSVSDLPAVPVQVVDTVGAGDAFTASMTLGLLAGHNLETINRNAIATASFVCSQPGATMPFPDQLRRGARV